MRLLNFKKRRHKLLAFIGIFTLVPVLVFAVIKFKLFYDDIKIARNWEIIHARTSDSTDFIRALRYLAKQGESLADIDLSCTAMGGIVEKGACTKEKISLQGLDLSPRTLEITSGVDLRHAKLIYTDLSNTDLRGADLSSANLFGADLSNANVSEANLSNAVISNANFASTNFSNTKLTSSHLLNTNFFGSSLLNADLSNANLSNAHLFAVNLSAANFSSTVFNQGTIIDYAWVWKTSDIKHPKSYFPIGIPSDRETTIEPAYLCPKKNFLVLASHIKKTHVKRRIENNCNPYVPNIEQAEQPLQDTDIPEKELYIPKIEPFQP